MRRWWWFATALCTALAVAVPVTWWVGRPTASEGVRVVEVGAPAGPPAAAPAAPSVVPAADSPAAGAPDGGSLPTMSARPAAPPPVGADDSAAPVSVTVPAIDLDAVVDPVGVEADGSMVIPREVDRVGWYRFGSAPGAAAGAAVLAGHVDSRRQGAGALFRLREVGVGDRVDVQLADGRSVRYRVVGKQTLVKKRLPTQTLFARDGAPRLVLITCGGPFVEALSSYRDNLVVVAEPVAGSDAGAP